IRAGSIFMLPVYVWILVFVGIRRGVERPPESVWSSEIWVALGTAVAVLAVMALVQLLEFPFRSTASHGIFRLAVINTRGKRARRSSLYARWAAVWLPLFVPVGLVAMWMPRNPEIACVSVLGLLLLWIGGALYTVLHPYRGLQDRLARTWVVRR
ncbi:MAG: RDD family protein, partial [Desulfobacterales bacterium]|nr:RDD family protein [Desulfobacterales bacterium]